MFFTIRLLAFGGEGSWEFSDSFLIGQQPYGGLGVNDESVARQHVEVQREQGRWRLRDLCGGMNGTFLNGERLGGEERLLMHGDVLRVGNRVFLVTALPSSVRFEGRQPQSAAEYFRAVGYDGEDFKPADSPTLDALTGLLDRESILNHGARERRRREGFPFVVGLIRFQCPGAALDALLPRAVSVLRHEHYLARCTMGRVADDTLMVIGPKTELDADDWLILPERADCYLSFLEGDGMTNPLRSLVIGIPSVLEIVDGDRRSYVDFHKGPKMLPPLRPNPPYSSTVSIQLGFARPDTCWGQPSSIWTYQGYVPSFDQMHDIARQALDMAGRANGE